MDFLPTKGIEYLLVIAYLVTLIPVWWLLRRTSEEGAGSSVAVRERAAPSPESGWFDVPLDRLFHRGHTWAQSSRDGVLTVGIDDFAQKLLGQPDAVVLPAAGQVLEQGGPGWQLRVGDHLIDVLSPVPGEVVVVNDEAVRTPEIVGQDPYGRGWLLKVRTPNRTTALKNLMPGRLARVWADETADRISQMMGRELGVVLQDGGVPISGFARQLAGADWPRLAAELLMTAAADDHPAEMDVG